jgi:hypothetical protein
LSFTSIAQPSNLVEGEVMLVKKTAIEGLAPSSISREKKSLSTSEESSLLHRPGSEGTVLELCPRGNNKDVIIIILVHDNVYIPC